MRNILNKPAKWANLLILIAFLFSFGLVSAQDDNTGQDEDQVEEAAEEEDEEVAELGNVTVTGSRLQRATYSSIAPLQIITAEGSREAGLIDAAAILQRAPAATGQQIDLTFQGFVLDNGPGASTLSLRGLGSARTLVLLNGRRLAPAGVEGAPRSPDLNLIPSALVQQYDLLLDGASSIYGSDAVAGVANIILRNDFDGLEAEVFTSVPEFGSGARTNLSLVWGKNFDRGFIGVGANYENVESVQLSDVDWTDECNKHYEIDQNGNIRTQDLFYETRLGMEWDQCRLGSLASRVSVPEAFSIYYTPGFTNGGWPDFSESSSPFGTFGVDGDGDGRADINFRDYDLNGKIEGQRQHLIPEFERFNFMAYGEYVFEGDWNNTFFFELGYNERDTFQNSAEGQLFPSVPGTNPFNICNPDGVNGVDCGLAYDALLTNPNYIQDFANTFFEGSCAPAGLTFEQCTPAAFGLLVGELGAQAVTPIVSVRGDRNFTSTNIKQYRAVAGFRGDLPFMDFGPFSSWQYDVYGSYTESRGEASRDGVRGDRLTLSLTTSRFDENGNIVCGDGTDGCVPINLFAPSLYPIGDSVTGDFATQAERDYLFDSRDFDTVYKQTIFSGFTSGFVGNAWGGPITAGLGFEIRKDDINSIPDEVAREGLFFGFFADGGAVGDKVTKELFAEVEVPLIAGEPGIEELTFNLSGRLTDDEFYGTAYTYSGKLGWRPTSSLLLRGTYGTSYRAPNVRELFLRDQTGFGNVTDACITPEVAIDEFTGGYNPDLDPRDSVVLQNCINQGVDPTNLGNGIQTLSTEISTGGVTDIDEETSTSFTYGFSFEQPWFDAFNLSVGATYYDIEIEDAIIEPSAQFLVNDCLGDEQFDSVFCDRVVRDSDGFIDIVTAGFINRDEETIRGVDININYDQDFSIADRPLNFAADIVVNHSIEARQVFVGDDGLVDTDDDDSQFGFPNWQGTSNFRFSSGDWTFAWQTRFIGNVRQDPDGVDDFNDIFDSQGTGRSDTCLGPPNDVLCRDLRRASEYFEHTASINYELDNWTFRLGVSNIFDEAPPFVDSNEGGAVVNNIPIGFGYDEIGRTVFFNVAWRQ